MPFSFGGLAGITKGPDGNVWFLNIDAGHVGRITPSGAITQFHVPRPMGFLNGIVTGPDSRLWFISELTDVVGRTSLQGVMAEFVATAGGGICEGPDGNLWAGTERASIGRMTPTGVATVFPVPRDEVFTDNIVTGPDGNLWCTEDASGLIRMRPDGSFIRIRIPRPAADIVAGPDGNLWFTMPGSTDPNNFAFPSIGRMPPDASGVTQFFIDDLEPNGITVGPDEALWFVGNSQSLVGRLSTQGALTLALLPRDRSFPWDIVTGSDGNLWLTEQGSRTIARVTPDWVITEFAVSLRAGSGPPPWWTQIVGFVTCPSTPPRRPDPRAAARLRDPQRYVRLAEAVDRTADSHPAVTEISLASSYTKLLLNPKP